MTSRSIWAASICSFQKNARSFSRTPFCFPGSSRAGRDLLQSPHRHRGRGGQTPIIAAIRLSGKIGRNTNVGFLSMQTESVRTDGTPSNNFMVARVRQDFANRSNIGVMFVNRLWQGSSEQQRLHRELRGRRAPWSRTSRHHFRVHGRDRNTRRHVPRHTHTASQQTTNPNATSSERVSPK